MKRYITGVLLVLSLYSNGQSISEIQGQTAISPYLGETVSTTGIITGIITGIHATGYLIQAESTA